MAFLCILGFIQNEKNKEIVQEVCAARCLPKVQALAKAVLVLLWHKSTRQLVHSFTSLTSSFNNRATMQNQSMELRDTCKHEPFSFLGLPSELRCLIYEAIFYPRPHDVIHVPNDCEVEHFMDWPAEKPYKVHTFDRSLINIQLACHQLYDEINPIFYRRLRLSVLDLSDPSGGYHRLEDKLHPYYRQHLQALSLENEYFLGSCFTIFPNLKSVIRHQRMPQNRDPWPDQRAVGGQAKLFSLICDPQTQLRTRSWRNWKIDFYWAKEAKFFHNGGVLWFVVHYSLVHEDSEPEHFGAVFYRAREGEDPQLTGWYVDVPKGAITVRQQSAGRHDAKLKSASLLRPCAREICCERRSPNLQQANIRTR